MHAESEHSEKKSSTNSEKKTVYWETDLRFEKEVYAFPHKTWTANFGTVVSACIDAASIYKNPSFLSHPILLYVLLFWGYSLNVFFLIPVELYSLSDVKPSRLRFLEAIRL